MRIIPVISESFEIMQILWKSELEEQFNVEQNPNYKSSAVELFIQGYNSNFFIYLDLVHIHNPHRKNNGWVLGFFLLKSVLYPPNFFYCKKI